jgi:hypothetical protein
VLRKAVEGVLRHYRGPPSCYSITLSLVPARTDTKWWHAFAMKHEIRLLRGCLRFGEALTSAPFPSAVVVMRPSSFRLQAFDREQR